MRTALLLCAALLLSGPAQAVFSLRVSDPRVSWSTQQGTLEEATLSIRPVELYLEYGLYLTFSARGAACKPTDSLEVTFRFELPANAIVHDSWLWISNDISRLAVWAGKDASGNDPPAGIFVASGRISASKQTALRIAKNSP
ncbi:MAG: hypothetical protein RMJ33_11470 [Saprospiraceae bacterium]|nr:hypothetical protein [Saprospiraceae bacterium]MDW8230448.1 hypothetical protein [Saprospiraceae bacterium]